MYLIFIYFSSYSYYMMISYFIVFELEYIENITKNLVRVF